MPAPTATPPDPGEGVLGAECLGPGGGIDNHSSHIHIWSTGGQRQSIPGDRYTGKSPISLPVPPSASMDNSLGSISGSGSQRLYGTYAAINSNSNKSSYIIHNIYNIISYNITTATHNSPSAMPSISRPRISVTVGERIRDRGGDAVIRLDDPPKHAKPHRQIPSIIGTVPSRDAYPADISNTHSAIPERSGKSRMNYSGGSITATPTTETNNSDTTEFIATNAISTTDRQSHRSKRPLLEGLRPPTDSGLPAPRIGPNAQCKLMKIMSSGIKNSLTTPRSSTGSVGSGIDLLKLTSPKLISYQDHLLVPSTDYTMFLPMILRHNLFVSSAHSLHVPQYFPSNPCLSYLYIIHIGKSLFP